MPKRIETVVPQVRELPPIPQIFIRGLYKGGWLPADEATKYVELLLHPETLGERINSCLEKLQGYSVTPRTAQNPRIQLGWKTLERFFGARKPVLQLYDASLWVYGSMIYDDPVSLDFDLLLISEKEDYRRQTQLVMRWMDELNLVWDKKVGEEGHIDWLCMDKLSKHHQEIQARNTKYVYDKDYYIHMDYLNAAVVLTGYPLVPPKRSYIVASWKRQIIDTIPTNPILATCVYDNLEDTLKNREARRKS